MVAATALALCYAGSSAAAQKDAEAPNYVHAGEALSSTQSGGTIKFSTPRMFTIYLLEDACERVGKAKLLALRVSPSVVRLKVGQLFSLDMLSIVATDTKGQILPEVPLAIEFSSPQHGLTLAFPKTPSANTFRAAKPGSLSVRARALCSGQDVEVSFPVTVAER
jgi:hypothetical protein